MARIVNKFIAVVLALVLALPAQGFAQVVPSASVSSHVALVLPAGDFTPALLRGIKIEPKEPFRFSFILDAGAMHLSQGELKAQGEKLTRYFLAALAIPRKDLWVNLSPYEKERIIPEVLGQTDLGEGLLSQDYLLKQLAASLTYPDSETGKKYWQSIDGVGARSPRPGRGNPAPTANYNKVWIMPDYVKVYTNGNSAYITESRLKVMTQEDYLAMRKNNNGRLDTSRQGGTLGDRSTTAFKQYILPMIEKDVNTGKNFVQLRQIFYALTLAIWYKENLKQTILNQQYANMSRVKGIDSIGRAVKEKIYNQYLQAFQKGAYDYIKRERTVCKITKRRYFSGGFEVGDEPYIVHTNVKPPDDAAQSGALTDLDVGLRGDGADGEKLGVPAKEPLTPLDAIRKALAAGDIAGAKAICERNFVPVAGVVDNDGPRVRLWIENAEREEQKEKQLAATKQEHLARVAAIKIRMAGEGAAFLLDPLLEKGEESSAFAIKWTLRQITVLPGDIAAGSLANLRVVKKEVIPGEDLSSSYTGQAMAAELMIPGNATPLHLLLYYGDQGKLVRIFIRKHVRYESEGEHAGLDPLDIEFTDIRLRNKPGVFSEAEGALLDAISRRVQVLAGDYGTINEPIADKSGDYQLMRPMVHDKFSRDHMLEMLRHQPGLEYLLDFMQKSMFYITADKTYMRFNQHPESRGSAGAVEFNGVVYTDNKICTTMDFSHEVTHAVFDYLERVLGIGHGRVASVDSGLLYERRLYYALVDYFKKSHMHRGLQQADVYRHIYDGDGKIKPDQLHGAVTEAFAHTMESILGLTGHGALRVSARLADVQFLVKMGLLPEYFWPAGFMADSPDGDRGDVSLESYYFPLVVYLYAHGQPEIAETIFNKTVNGNRASAAEGLAVLAKHADAAVYDRFAARELKQSYFTDALNLNSFIGGMDHDLLGIYQECMTLGLEERAQEARSLLEAEATKAPMSFIELLNPELEPRVAVEVVQLFVKHANATQRFRIRESFADLQMRDISDSKGLAGYYQRILDALDASQATLEGKTPAGGKTGGVDMTQDDFVKFSGTKTLVSVKGTQGKTVTIVRLFPVVLKATPVKSLQAWLK